MIYGLVKCIFPPETSTSCCVPGSWPPLLSVSTCSFTLKAWTELNPFFSVRSWLLRMSFILPIHPPEPGRWLPSVTRTMTVEWIHHRRQWENTLMSLLLLLSLLLFFFFFFLFCIGSWGQSVDTAVASSLVWGLWYWSIWYNSIVNSRTLMYELISVLCHLQGYFIFPRPGRRAVSDAGRRLRTWSEARYAFRNLMCGGICFTLDV